VEYPFNIPQYKAFSPLTLNFNDLLTILVLYFSISDFLLFIVEIHWYSWDRSVGIAMGWMARPGFNSQQDKISFFSIESIQALGSTQLPVQWVLWLYPEG
jgi:hypothetical protein